MQTNTNTTRSAAILLLVMLMGIAILSVARPVTAQNALPIQWQSFYWNNNNFTGNYAFASTDSAISFNWGTGSPRTPEIPADNFSARYYGTINLSAQSNFTLRAGADDGIRVAVDGNIVINRFTQVDSFQLTTVDITLGAGPHQIIVDYFEATGNAGVLFEVYPQGSISTGPGIIPSSTPIGTLVSGSGSAAVVAPQVVKAEVIVTKTNIRSGPGITFPQIGEATRGQRFIAVARNGSFGMQTWYLLELGNGSRGWILRPNIYLFGGNSDNLPVSSEITAKVNSAIDGTTANIVTGLAQDNLVIRSAPSKTSGERNGVVNKGTTLVIVKLSNNRAWVKVEVNGTTGWVFLPNVKVISGKLGALPRGND